MKQTQPRTVRVLIALFLIQCLVFSNSLRAEPMREFIMSCTYGVLAGTLVGAATLAFTDKPGDNLNRVARGASIGLYSGIVLGVYVVYFVPSQRDQLDVPDYYKEGDYPEIQSQYQPSSPSNWRVPNIQLLPIFRERELDGVMAQLRVTEF